MPDLERMRDACRIVAANLEHEIDVFDVVWETFWQRIGHANLEDVEVREWKMLETSLAHLGALGGEETQALDTLYVIASMVQAAASLLKTDSEITTVDVATELSAAASRTGAPPHIHKMLERHGVGLLAEHLKAVDWEEQPNREQDVRGQLWVEWCEKCPGIGQLPDLKSGFFPVESARETFVENEANYSLLVDERATHIVVRPLTTRNVPAKKRRRRRFDDLDARHKVLLGLILQSFQRDGIIKHQRIAEHALKRTSLTTGGKGSIRTMKSQLNSYLYRILDGTLVTEKASEQYRVERQIPYCWIRCSDTESRLLPDQASP